MSFFLTCIPEEEFEWWIFRDSDREMFLFLSECFSRIYSHILKSGFGFPIPNGLKWSISSSVLISILFGGREHSIDRTFFGRLVISCTWANCFHRASFRSWILLLSIVNPAAWRWPPYRTKKSLQLSRSSIRLHHSGERQEAIERDILGEVSISRFVGEELISIVSHFRFVRGWSCHSLITMVGLLYISVRRPATSQIIPCSRSSAL